MSKPFIIWCEYRTGSSTLDAILKSLSELPDAYGEPFDHNGQFGYVPSAPDRDHLLADICHHQWTIRHVFLSLPQDFNIALAKAATAAGYRHIRLMRDPVARAASQWVAEVLDTWIADGRTRHILADQTKALPPMDIGRWVDRYRAECERWREISLYASRSYWVGYEQIFTGPLEKRRTAIAHLSAHLLQPLHSRWRSEIRHIDHLLMSNGQNTQVLWPLIPNIGELRRAFLEVR